MSLSIDSICSPLFSLRGISPRRQSCVSSLECWPRWVSPSCLTTSNILILQTIQNIAPIIPHLFKRRINQSIIAAWNQLFDTAELFRYWLLNLSIVEWIALKQCYTDDAEVCRVRIDGGWEFNPFPSSPVHSIVTPQPPTPTLLCCWPSQFCVCPLPQKFKTHLFNLTLKFLFSYILRTAYPDLILVFSFTFSQVEWYLVLDTWNYTISFIIIALTIE